jgi:hypothetical protein
MNPKASILFTITTIEINKATTRFPRYSRCLVLKIYRRSYRNLDASRKTAGDAAKFNRGNSIIG